MLSRTDLLKITRARVTDAKILLSKNRWDGAVYLCGYAVELALKSRIVVARGLAGFPETDAEFKALKPLWLKIHKLDDLLALSDREVRVRTKHMNLWSGVVQWEPEVRYRRIGSASLADAVVMVACTDRLLRVLWAK